MTDRRPFVFALAGAVAALTYFGSSEFLAGILSLTSAPLLVLGQTIIPLVPTALIKAAIALFGTGDKLALVITIAVVGVLIEVPVMLTVVAIVNRSKGWYERNGVKAAARPAE